MATEFTDLAGNVFVNVNVTSVKNDNISATEDPLSWKAIAQLSFGDSIDEADLLYHESGVVTPVGSNMDILNLYDGSLKTPFGDDARFNAVKMLIVKNTSEYSSIQLSGSSWVGPWLDDSCAEVLYPGDVSVHIAAGEGWAVTSDEDELLLMDLDHEENATYEIIVIGVSQ